MAFRAFVTNILGLDGTPESGGLLQSYVKGTTTPLPLYESDGTTPLTNPVVAESLGQIVAYFNDALQYSWQAKTADGATILWEADVVAGVLTLSFVNPDYDVFPIVDLQAVRSVATYAALTGLVEATGLIDGAVYCTKARATAGDGGFAVWRYDASSAATADNYTTLAIDGGGSGRFLRLDHFDGQGSSGAPFAVDGAFGFTGHRRTYYFTPGTGSAPATSTPDEVNVHMAAGSNGIGTAHLTRVYTDGSWTNGGEAEAGVIGHAYEVYLTKGGVGFGTSKYITVSTTTGSRPRGNETDFERAVNYDSLWGDIYITTGAVDTGVATGTIAFTGGTLPAEGVRGVAATGSGGGFAAVDVIYKPSGGVEPIRATGHLYAAVGGTCVSGAYWRYWTFTGQAFDLPIGTQIRAVSGNSFARMQTALNTHDDLFHSVNYNHVAAAVDNAGLGTASQRTRAVSGGRGEFTWMTGNANTAPATRMTLQSGLLMVGATGGDKGDGTINATAVYDDNVLLSCFVLDAALDGEVDLAKWDAKVPDRVHEVYETLEIDGEQRSVKTGDRVEVRTHVGALKFSQRLGTEYDPLTLDGYAKHWKEKRHLTAFPNEARFQHGDMSTGEWMQRCIETLEIQAVLIEKLNEEVKLLKQYRSKQDQDGKAEDQNPGDSSSSLAHDVSPETSSEVTSNLDAALEAARETHAELFSDTDDITDKQRVEAERDEARESLRVANERIAELESREPEVRIERVEVERIVEVPAAVVEPDPPAAPYVPDFTLIPDALAKYAEADESAEDFRKRAFNLLFRFGINEGEHFEGAGPLSPDERIKLVPMLVANFKAGNWLSLSEQLQTPT